MERSQILKAGIGCFAPVFTAGFVFGALRLRFVVPRLGVRTAELLERPLMLAVMVLAARGVCRRFAMTAAGPAPMIVGAIALALLVVAELALALLLQDQTLRDDVVGRDPVSGSVYLLMLLVFAALPRLLARQGSPRQHGR